MISSIFYQNVITLVLCALFFIYPLNVNAAGRNYWADVGVIKVGEKKPVPAPDFTLNNLDGRRVSLKDFKGKVIFLNFWATWCPPCVIEMPSMDILHKRYKDKGLVVLAVNSEEGVKKVSSFIKNKSYTFPVLLDSDGSVINNSYRAMGFPTTYLIDRNGMMIGKAEGAREWDSLESFKLIEEILKR